MWGFFIWGGVQQDPTQNILRIPHNLILGHRFFKISGVSDLLITQEKIKIARKNVQMIYFQQLIAEMRSKVTVDETVMVDWAGVMGPVQDEKVTEPKPLFIASHINCKNV